MTEEDIFDAIEAAYVCLIHPMPHSEAWLRNAAPVIALAPLTPDELVSALIKGSSWRERLVGLCMSMTRPRADFVEPIIQSLHDPCGISTVPSFAALAVLARQGAFTMTKTFPEMFDRAVFDGELGWAADKAACYAGLLDGDIPGRGPNYGQIFESQIEFYLWLNPAGPDFQ